jgi:hypothetical protein
MAASLAPHRWTFFRAGGVDQVLLRDGADVANLKHLDQKLWVALSCPVAGLEFDERTLRLLDRDQDGRVRVPEILAAVEWLSLVLKNLDVLFLEKDEVALSDIRTDTPEGTRILGAIRIILRGLEHEDAGAISLANAMETQRVMTAAEHNGDGIVPPESLRDPALRRAGLELLAAFGGTPDRSGRPGFDAARVAGFYDALAARAAWLAEGLPREVRPLGDATAVAHEAVERVAAKIEDWFTRARLASVDPAAGPLLNAGEAQYREISGGLLEPGDPRLAAMPLARVVAEEPLPLLVGVNPAWAEAVEVFRERALRPLLGGEGRTLALAEWRELRARLEPHRAWKAREPHAALGALDAARVRELLQDGSRAGLEAAIRADLAVAGEFSAVVEVERLVRYARHLRRLLDNFVSFADFYGRKRPAVFQSGRLHLDGRACDLVVRVADAGKHAALAGLARSFLAYCDLRRPDAPPMSVAAAFTAGDSDQLMVGRNGLFYDHQGRDWDATVTKLLDHPISVGQAFFAPYKRVLRWIEEQVAKRAAAADEASTGTLTAAAEATGEAATKGAAAAPRPKFDVGVVAALGVAVGGIAAAFGGLLNAFFGLGIWMPLGVLGLILLISGPSMIIAWLKLRERNLGPILDANGWAVNGRMKVNIPLGAALTEVAVLPPESSRQLHDPFAEKRRVWPRLLVGLLVLLGLAWGLWRWEGAPAWARPVRDALRVVVPYGGAASSPPDATLAPSGSPEAPR